MDTNGVSLADIAAVTGNGSDGMFGGNGGMWIFALLILVLLGNGGLFGGSNLNAVSGERVATQADIQRAVDFDTLKQSISGVNETVITTGANTVSAVKDLGYNQLGEIRDLQAETARGTAAIQSSLAAGFANQEKCCCELKSTILENRYLDEKNAASIMANDTANTQKILDAIAGNRMADMQNQINALQLQNAVAGVVRYPMSTAYCSGANPFGCGCGGCANI